MKKVLIIDDEWKIRKLIKDYLIREEFVVDEAEDGEVGLEFYSKLIYNIKIIKL